MNLKHSAIEPTSRNMWLELHERHREELAGSDPRVVFAGDSLTDAWQYQPSWRGALAPYRPINLGIGGDCTQHLLWRLQDHALPPAPLYWLLIGTNNIGCNATGEILEGIAACRDEILRQCPASKVLLVHLLPRQYSRAEPAFQQVCAVNAAIPSLVDGRQVFHAEFASLFQLPGAEDCHLDFRRMSEDCVHLTPRGYEAWAEAAKPVLDRYLAMP